MRVTGRRRAAEEATQDAFLGLWRAARSYDMNRGTLKTWLLSMVRNRSIDCLRREARHDRDLQIDDALVTRLEAAERTEQRVADLEESRHARQLLVSLPDDQRRVIELAYFKGLTQTEIAEKVGCSPRDGQRAGSASHSKRCTEISQAVLRNGREPATQLMLSPDCIRPEYGRRMRVLIPLPDRDFDVTEVAVPWRLLTDAGHEVVFATERGAQRPGG